MARSKERSRSRSRSTSVRGTPPPTNASEPSASPIADFVDVGNDDMSVNTNTPPIGNSSGESSEDEHFPVETVTLRLRVTRLEEDLSHEIAKNARQRAQIQTLVNTAKENLIDVTQKHEHAITAKMAEAEQLIKEKTKKSQLIHDENIKDCVTEAERL